MVKFGMIFMPTSWPDAVQWARQAEELGFDSVWTVDHARLEPGFRVLDGPTIIGGVAAATTRVRVGLLVGNLILRQPVLMVKHAIALDHISGGRAEFGIGAGLLETDHAMMGLPVWEPPERVARLAEATEIADRLLRGMTSPYRGSYYRYTRAVIAPRPIQRPRPPITVGVYSSMALGTVARFADRWNTVCGFRMTDAEFCERIPRRMSQLDEACARLGRDPATVLRSLLVFPTLRPWREPGALERIVERYVPLGFGEFIVYAPWPGERRMFERSMARLLGASSAWVPDGASPAPGRWTGARTVAQRD